MVMLFDYILFEFTTVRNDTCVMCDLEFKNILTSLIIIIVLLCPIPLILTCKNTPLSHPSRK